MYIDEFNLDVDHAYLTERLEKEISKGRIVVRSKFENGFIWIYTKMPDGSFTNMDFSHELTKNGNVFTPDMNSVKQDFKDYYDLI